MPFIFWGICLDLFYTPINKKKTTMAMDPEGCMVGPSGFQTSKESIDLSIAVTNHCKNENRPVGSI